jgi:Transcriptional activator TraM
MTTDNADSIDVDELIAKVAKKYNVLISKDDPILVTVLLNDLILQNYIDQIKKNTSALKNDFRGLSQMIIDDSKSATHEAITDAAITSSTIFTAEFKKHLAQFNMRNEQFNREINASKKITFLACGISFLFMVVSVSIFLFKQ